MQKFVLGVHIKSYKVSPHSMRVKVKVHYCHVLLNGVIVDNNQMVIVPLNLVQLSTEDRGEHQLNILAHSECYLAVLTVYYIKT